MSFVYSNYIYLVVVSLALIVFFLRKNEKSFYDWVYDNWFYERSLTSKLSSFAFILAIGFLLLSLLDLRGAEQKVEGEVSDKKTILLIDSSLSMLAEDVRPNRYGKAVFIARHFIKNSAGHKISVILFSDTHKKLVPFTMDRELLDSRVAALSDIGVSGGGTGLKQAIQESIQYFGTGKKKSAGNIIIITDAEETNQGFNLEVPENITVAVVGVGTARGAPIPLRDGRGISRGFKKHQGKNVTTKLDENFLKKIGEDIKYYNYWIASSFSLPTDEILNFFNQSVEDRKSKDNVTIRPVYAEVLMIPGVLLLILSFILRFFKAFNSGVALSVVLIMFLPRVFGQEQEEKPPSPEEVKREEEIQNYLNKWKKRELSEEEKLDLASKYSQNKVDDKADVIYEKILKNESVNDQTKYDHFNWATTKLRKKEFKESLKNLKNIKKYLEKNPSEENEKLLEDVRKNTLLALKQQKKSDKEKKKKGDKGDSKDKKQKSEGQEKKNKKEKKNQQDKGDKDQGDSDKKKEEQEKSDQGDQKKNDKKRKKKLPGLLKQLLNDDRKLQKQLLDTSTNKKDNQNKRKDW